MVLMKVHGVAINFGVQDEYCTNQAFRLIQASYKNVLLKNEIKKENTPNENGFSFAFIYDSTIIDSELLRQLNICKLENRQLLLTFLNLDSIEKHEFVRETFQKIIKRCREEGVKLNFLVLDGLMVDRAVEIMIDDICVKKFTLLQENIDNKKNEMVG